jgi:membrane-associated phospholipid phosphatase
MIPLLLAFLALAALLCLLVGADDPAGADPGAFEPDPLERWRAAPPHDQAKPGAATPSGHTASGLAGGR